MLNYLLESSCCWGVLYLFYTVLLSREKTFTYNRAYLLLALVLGLLAPVFSFAPPMVSVLLVPIDLAAVAAPTLENLAQAAITSFDLPFIMGGYCLGLLLFAGRFLGGLHRILAIYKNNQVETCANYQLVTMKENYPPFSFAHCLFVPQNLTQDFKAYQCILTHEAAHIQQLHSLDILLVELLQITFWFNPILILYKMALRDQHEYLADQVVLRNTSVAQYGQLLLDQSVATVLPLVHPFFHSSLKKRIIMMTTTSKRIPLVKYAFSLLAFVLTFWMVSCQKSNKRSTVVAQPDVMPYLASCDNEDKIEQKQCSQQKLLKYIYGNIKYPESAKEAGAEGMAVLRFVVEKNGHIGDMQLVRSTENEALDAEALRVLAKIKKDNELWKPGMKDGKAVRVSLSLPLRFKTQ